MRELEDQQRKGEVTRYCERTELIASGEIDPVLMYLSSGSAGSSG
jgi:hypothetical protein